MTPVLLVGQIDDGMGVVYNKVSLIFTWKNEDLQGQYIVHIDHDVDIYIMYL